MKLIFIYDAGSGAIRSWLDGAHKLLSPATYACNLCQLTYGTFGENRKWKQFRKQFPGELLFLHKDEFTKTYASKWLPRYDFPIILEETAGGLSVLINSEELKNMKKLEELILAIQNRTR